ncbi:glycosyltransferase family 2 protein [Sandarakinorhabdus sp. DWP1-3-1]|uniref:glycosyltransferase family 2 protein n=1 Tax=Sandarakinorhabdus sp. DWP1-3-1 TaxID=2804627 RepID=UPI003CEE8FCD
MLTRTGTRPPLVSVLVPAYNEEANVERAYKAIVATFATIPDHDFEIIFSDNHSTDATFDVLKRLAAIDPRVRVLRLSRNYGYQRSLLLAYQSARGDCSVQIDCDLQDPPELIPQMLARWAEGHQVVYGVRRSLAEGRLVSASRRLFYRAMRALSEDDLPLDAGEFRLVDACVLAQLRTVEDTSPYLRGLISSMGFSQVGFPYDRQARVAGESKFPLGKMIALGVDGLLNHSLVPLRMASMLGLAVGTVTLLLIIGYLVGRLVFGAMWPAGFATTTLLILLSITLNAMFLGIIGEYVGRIFMQSKRRMLPIVERSINFDGDVPATAMDPKRAVGR